MSEKSVKYPDHTSNPDTDTNHQSEAPTQQASDKSSNQKNQKSLPKTRPTHFLCFPLVTNTSVPQLAKSLRHFREVTTKPTHHDRFWTKKNEDQTQPGDDDDVAEASLETDVGGSEALPPSNPDLQLLPAVVHRPPGTFHLTLGIMDLSTEEAMSRALNLLQELNYSEIFNSVVAQGSEDDSLRRTRATDEEEPSGKQTVKEGRETETLLTSLTRPISPPPTSSTPNHSTSNFHKDNPLQISLTGLSTFPSARSSRVFYAKPTPIPTSSFPLLNFGKAIQNKFREAGFITETRPLVLHATVANMKYATQTRGGRTSKGKTWRYGKDRFTDGQIDAREIIKCFDYYAGNVQDHLKGTPNDGGAQEFLWAENIVLNRVAICKMGAENSDDEVLGKVYPPVGEKAIFD